MPSNQANLTPEKRERLQTDKVIQALPRGAARQAGTSILTTTISNINGFLNNPDAFRIYEYERAMTTDDAIASGLDFIVLALTASLGDFVHKRPEITAFVRAAMNNMEGNWRQAFGELALSSLWSGFGTSEIIWTAEGKSLWIERLANYHSASIHLAVDINGYLKEGGEPMVPGARPPGMYQLSPFKGMGQYIPLPMNKMCLLTHRKRNGNYYGESLIRRIYKYWKYKDPGLEMWAVALDRYGTPMTFAIVPRVQTGNVIADSRAEGGTRPEMLSDNAASVLAGAHTGTGIVLEQPDPNNKVTLGNLGTGNNYGTTFENFIGYLDRSIYRGMLIPQTIFNESRGGGINSTSKTHFEVFKELIKSLYYQLVEPFRDQVVGRLIRYNFNETDPGEFPIRPFDATMAETLANMLEKMVTVGIVDPSDLTDVNEARAYLGLSQKTKTAVEKFGQIIKDHNQDNQTKLEVAHIRAKAVDTAAQERSAATVQAADVRIKTVGIQADAAVEVAKINNAEPPGGPTPSADSPGKPAPSTAAKTPPAKPA